MTLDLKNKESMDFTQISTSVGPSRTSQVATRRKKVNSGHGSFNSTQTKNKSKHHHNISLHVDPNDNEQFLEINNSIDLNESNL